MTAPARLRVVLVDDHPLVRAGIRAVLATLGGIDIVGESGDATAALELIRRERPDVALLDIALREGSGLAVARQVHAELPATRIVMLTMHSATEYVLEALDAGAVGFIIKDAAVSELTQCFEALRRGEAHYLPTVAYRAIAGQLDRNGAAGVEGHALSPRQREILKLIAEGSSTSDVAATLKLSAKAVQTHRAHIIARIGIRDVAGLTRHALRIGLIDRA